MGWEPDDIVIETSSSIQRSESKEFGSLQLHGVGGLLGGTIDVLGSGWAYLTPGGFGGRHDVIIA
jgi:hypothetical protein